MRSCQDFSGFRSGSSQVQPLKFPLFRTSQFEGTNKGQQFDNTNNLSHLTNSSYLASMSTERATKRRRLSPMREDETVQKPSKRKSTAEPSTSSRMSQPIPHLDKAENERKGKQAEDLPVVKGLDSSGKPQVLVFARTLITGLELQY